MTMPWGGGSAFIPSGRKWNSPSLDNPPTGIKVWGSGEWVLRPVRVWDGASWVARPLKRWDGTAWVECGL